MAKSWCQTSHQIIQFGQGFQNLLTHQLPVFYLQINWKGCPSPSFYILWGSEFITYLPKCLPQTPFNRNCSTKHMWWNPTKCRTQQRNSMVCLDLSAAFDTVNHTILKTVMEYYFSLEDTALQWLRLYVSDRQFSVQIGNSFSQMLTINFSVP